MPEATFEVGVAASGLRYYGALVLTEYGRVAEWEPGHFSLLVREPIGVAGISVPWNSPVALLIRSLAPALASGCTTVVKMPAETAQVNALISEVISEVTSLLSLPEIRYLLWSLSLRAWTDTVRQSMPALLVALLAALQSVVRSRLELGAEILALRHQLAVLQRQTPKRPRLGHADRWLWVLLSRVWWNWRSALQLVRPDTVVRWHRRGFARYWRWRSSRRRPGRPALAVDVRALIQQMHGANPRWGAPRVHGELRKLGLHIAQATVATYLARHRGTPPTQTWRTFLTNHASQLASCDFFTVPTATFRVLFVFVVLSHDRRRIVHINVTAHPTAVWTAQQLREAWPWDTAPRFLIRDRDTIYTSDLRRTVQAIGVEEVLTAPRSPWQNPFVERVIGSLRRECVDHLIVWNERSLRRHLQQYLAYYHEWRTHLSLDKDAPVPRAEQAPACGAIVAVPHVGGLHHHYERRAA